MKGGLHKALLLGLCCGVICNTESEKILKIPTEVKNDEGESETNDKDVDEVNLYPQENVDRDYNLNDANSKNKFSQRFENFINRIDKFNDDNNQENVRSKAWEINESKHEISSSEVDDEVMNDGVKGNLASEDENISKNTILEIKRRILSHFIRSQNDTNGFYDSINHLNATMAGTQNHFYSSAGDEKERQVILHGTKAWTFPMQDVNLTLSYPTAKTDSYPDLEEKQCIITGFSVILNIDGTMTRGYITSGGILRDHITITFINTGITSLHYQFWLYGTPKEDNTQLNELYSPQSI